MDPLAELLEAIERDGKPPLPWVVRWSRGEQDPLAAVWRVTRSPEHLARLLGYVTEPAMAPTVRRVLDVVFISEQTDRDRARCADGEGQPAAEPGAKVEKVSMRSIRMRIRSRDE